MYMCMYMYMYMYMYMTQISVVLPPLCHSQLYQYHGSYVAQFYWSLLSSELCGSDNTIFQGKIFMCIMFTTSKTWQNISLISIKLVEYNVHVHVLVVLCTRIYCTVHECLKKFLICRNCDANVLTLLLLRHFS